MTSSRSVIMAVVVFLLGVVSDPAGAQSVKPSTKISSDLTDLHTRHALAAAAGLRATLGNPFLAVRGDRVVIHAVAAGDPATLAAELTALGAQRVVIARYLVSARVPIAAIPSLEGLTSLRQARPAYRRTRVGAVTSQGDVAISADRARARFGLDGSGVTVGVLSDSYDCLGGAAVDISSGDLPADVRVLDNAEGSCDFGIDEGRAMLQIIRDVAPAARLLFATADNGQGAFAQNILALRAAGASVIVDDISYQDEPIFQDGVIAEAIDQVTAAGATFFSAAGNDARNAYDHAFVPGVPLVEDFFPGGFFGGTPHKFGSTNAVASYLQTISAPGGGLVSVTLQWDSPFASVSGPPGSENDLDMYLLARDPLGQLFVVASATSINEGSDPVEIMTTTCDALPGRRCTYFLMIVNFSGPSPTRFKYLLIADPGTTVTPALNSGTVLGHPNAVGAIAVGAADYRKSPPFAAVPVVESFSSSGTTPILFDIAGNRLATPDPRPFKPELVAPDGVQTTFFGGAGFFGTSAAAPHAAGVAALIRQALPSATPADIRNALETTALNMATPGFDTTMGFGFIQADMALAALHAVSITAGPTGVPDLVKPGEAANLAVSATDSFGHLLTYAWTAACSGLRANGTFDDATRATPIWAAPANTTGVAQKCALTVTVDDGHGVRRSAGLTLSLLATPRIASFTPATGAVGTLVTLNGSSLSGVTAVTFGGNVTAPATVAGNQIRTTVPDGAVSGPLSVTNDVGIGATAGIFKVTAKVTSLTPSSGIVGDTVTIGGTSLTLGTQILQVKIGTAIASIVTTTPHAITAVIPPNASTGAVTVTTSVGSFTSGRLVFTVIKPPTISSFTPTMAPVGSTIMIAGSNLSFATAVAFNGTPVSAITPVSASSIKVVVPLGATTGKISVTNRAGTTTSTGIFKVTPKIEGFTPASGIAGETITLTGLNLTDAGGAVVRIGAAIAPVTLATPDSMQATIPPAATTGTLSVTTSSGTGTSAIKLIVIRPPTIASFSPTVGTVGTTVSINGANLDSVTTVGFGGTNTSAVTVVTANAIKVQVPEGAATGRITVTNRADSATSVGVLKVAPKITGFTPASGAAGDEILVTGFNLATGADPPRVMVGTVAAVVTAASAAEVRFLVPGPARTGKISLATQAGSATSASALVVTTPALPDLRVISVSGPGVVVRSTPAKLQTMMIKTTVTNQGPAVAGAFTVSVILVPAGEPPAPSNPPRVIGTRQVVGLAPGASLAAITPMVLPVDVVPGTWVLRAVADRGGVVTELHEDDNEAVAETPLGIVEALAGAGTVILTFDDSAFCRPAREFRGVATISQTLDRFTVSSATLSEGGATISGLSGTLGGDGSVSGIFTFRTVTEDAAVADEVQFTGFVDSGQLVGAFDGFDGATHCTFRGSLTLRPPPRPALSFDFFATGGYFAADASTATLVAPVAINSWVPIVSGTFDADDVDDLLTIVGPGGTGFVSTPASIDVNGAETTYRGGSVVTAQGLVEPPAGAWTIAYRGREFPAVVAAPQSKAHLAIPLPTLTIAAGVVTRIDWTYVTRTGAPLPAAPAFLRSIGVDLVDASGFALYESGRALPDKHSVEIDGGQPLFCIGAVAFNYDDTLGNRYRVSFATPNAGDCGGAANLMRPSVDSYLLTSTTRRGTSRLLAVSMEFRAGAGITQSATVTGDLFASTPLAFAGANRASGQVFDVFRLTANLSPNRSYGVFIPLAVDVTLEGAAAVRVDAIVNSVASAAEFSFTGFAASTFDITAVRGVTRTFTWGPPVVLDSTTGELVTIIPDFGYMTDVVVTNAKGERCNPGDLTFGTDPMVTLTIPAACVGQPTARATVCVAAGFFDETRSIHCRVYDSPGDEVPADVPVPPQLVR